MIDRSKVWEELKDRKKYTQFEESLGELVKSLLLDFKMILIRETWFRLTYPNEIRHDAKLKINNSIKHVETAISLILSLFKDPNDRARMLDYIDDQNLIYKMVLKEQLHVIPESELDELTELIADFIKKKDAEKAASKQDK